jgi:hypothetical protein
MLPPHIFVKRNTPIKHHSFSLDENMVPGHYKHMQNVTNTVCDWTAAELADFATAVKTAAARPQTAKYHGEMAFIASIKAEWFPRSDAQTFAAKLVAAHQAGLLRLRRADLVGAMDRAMVAASEVVFMSAEFHFVTV